MRNRDIIFYEHQTAEDFKREQQPEKVAIELSLSQKQVTTEESKAVDEI